MAVKIKLQRLGKIRTPHYRVVIADARTKRDGKVIENIGIYEPKAEPSVIKINSERAQHWLSVGAQPTEAVAALLKVTGDWQKFKGIEGAEGTLRVAEPKPSKLELFNQALSEANNGPTAEAITEKKKKAREDKEAKEAAEKAAAEKAAAAESEEAPAEEAAAEEA
ncbi:30S ribosomal protein S16 [Corynebacterium glutamicum MB001]|uniref:Small ribosomal subunit protein bS16 n=2 Tax=Corynebacterium glutamicum TaxID=1718 RepID=RS16_CORGL|nr:30S ribosomal protein S16 [Corynebacterium glutamicum]A4QFC1.1 RecName: Full=Small ribosomal subunit protein bS16; AltName: Full=30S ribosomal protein S16 [Corynebacterium glutamicum R]Q8NNX3.1 RecName: Full=Small ribosomal subunit protein bS16; AltName: Full=30S ribosomal protein S16 [Corynebacterium glutamicum ATCC 13032]AGT05791.1 30S ribosomal protein S16 [Corynebacterium glutamicum MB001]AJE67741.1 30S ribosomal protein S16 [Corynebacterium glutamicum]ARV63894.1 30S ribosomal protein S